MTEYKTPQEASLAGLSGGASSTVVARVSDDEREALNELARVHDRTPSREIRRAIRFYLENYELADRKLRARAVQRCEEHAGITIDGGL